jgi:hypothetical protein
VLGHRVTRVTHQRMLELTAPDDAPALAERWWAEVGSHLHAGADAKVVDTWIDRAAGTLIVVLSARLPQQLDRVEERTRAALEPLLRDFLSRDLDTYTPRPDFASEPATAVTSLKHTEPVRWNHIQILEDDRTLDIAYTRGVIHGLHHVEVDLDEWRATVTVYLGVTPEFSERMDEGPVFYPLVALAEWTRIVLAEPLGEREVADGAADRGA